MTLFDIKLSLYNKSNIGNHTTIYTEFEYLRRNKIRILVKKIAKNLMSCIMYF